MHFALGLILLWMSLFLGLCDSSSQDPACNCGRSPLKLTQLPPPASDSYLGTACILHELKTHSKRSTYTSKNICIYLCTHSSHKLVRSTGSARHMWAFAKINSVSQRTSVNACMEKHTKYSAPHTYLMCNSQGLSKSSPYQRPLHLNHLQGSATFIWCVACLCHKHAILLELHSH